MSKNLQYPNIRAELVRKGLTVQMLADFMGMTSQNLYGKLRGAIMLTEKDMRQIQEFFKANGGVAFTLDYLFSNNN